MAPIRRAALRPDFPSQPTDLDLATTYLRPFVATGERAKFIYEANVYDASPGAIAAKYAAAIASDGQEAWYFVTTLRSKSSRGRRKSRTVSSGEEGCWHSERAAKPLMAGIPHSRQIGYRQSFSFATKEDGRLVRSGWLMTEIGLNYEGPAEDQFVLCKVYRSPRVAPAPVPGANKSTAAAAKGKESECSASSEDAENEGGPSHPPLRYSAQQSSDTASMESDTSDAELTESDSEQESPIQGRVQIPRVMAGNTARTPRSEAHQAPQIPSLPSLPVRRMSAARGVAPGNATVSSGSDAPLQSFPRHPTDQELVKTYLIPRVASGENSWKFIHEADVYTAEPAILTGQYSPMTPTEGCKAWYFFTLLRAKSIHGRRRPRTVGSGNGCWHSESGARFVADGGRRIGRRQFFSFVKKEDGLRHRTGWIMVEIGLKHDQEEGSSDELVLCKVYRSPRARPARERKAAAAAVMATAATATESSGRKRKAKDNNSGSGTPVLERAPAVKKSKAAAAVPSSSSGRKRKANGKKTGAACPVLCARCRIETAETHNGTADAAAEEDETRARSETGILEGNSAGDDGSSIALRGGEAGDSSESARPPFYHFV